MQTTFWKKLKRPIMSVAPMSGITDEVFRRMLLKCGRPDVFWTEFVSVEGLFSKGHDKFIEDLKFLKKEHPIVAQVFGANPNLFNKTVAIIKNLGFDGIDINMGCPNKDIEKYGAGAALIKNPDLAKQIIRATKRGAGKFPVSVKTRIGYSKNQIEEWLPVLLGEKLAVLTVHLRTRKEMYKVPAHWELAKEIVKLRDRLAPDTLIFGNGDVKSLAEAHRLAKETGLDGIMVGRSVLGNPWFFSGRTPDTRERLDAISEHIKNFERLNKTSPNEKTRTKNFIFIKKFLKSYATKFKGAKYLRDCLMKVENGNEAREIIEKFLK
jgi:nifR3 family TIM-barrel protein